MNQEKCPLKGCQTMCVSEIFNHDGGEISIPHQGVKVMVPAGAISMWHKVQIEAAASLLGPFIIPKDYDPIGAFVWIAANYEFKKPLMIEIEHEAFITKDTNLSDLCILTAHEKDLCAEMGLYEMHEETCEYQHSWNKSYCTIFASHFCSKCLAKRSKAKIAKRVIMYHYLPEDYKVLDEFFPEVTFCYDIQSCKKVCIVYFSKYIDNICNYSAIAIHM